MIKMGIVISWSCNWHNIYFPHCDAGDILLAVGITKIPRKSLSNPSLTYRWQQSFGRLHRIRGECAVSGDTGITVRNDDNGMEAYQDECWMSPHQSLLGLGFTNTHSIHIHGGHLKVICWQSTSTWFAILGYQYSRVTNGRQCDIPIGVYWGKIEFSRKAAVMGKQCGPIVCVDIYHCLPMLVQ